MHLFYYFYLSLFLSFPLSLSLYIPFKLSFGHTLYCLCFPLSPFNTSLIFLSFVFSFQFLPVCLSYLLCCTLPPKHSIGFIYFLSQPISEVFETKLLLFLLHCFTLKKVHGATKDSSLYVFPNTAGSTCFLAFLLLVFCYQVLHHRLQTPSWSPDPQDLLVLSNFVLPSLPPILVIDSLRLIDLYQLVLISIPSFSFQYLIISSPD